MAQQCISKILESRTLVELPLLAELCNDDYQKDTLKLKNYRLARTSCILVNYPNLTTGII